MSDAVRIKAEQVKVIAAADIGSGLTLIDSITQHAARMILFQNLTDALLMFSLNGTTDHFPLASETYFVLDVATNRTATSEELYYPTGSAFYVRQIGTPTTGSVYVTIFYGK